MRPTAPSRPTTLTAGIAATVTSKYVTGLVVATGVITVTVGNIATVVNGGTITLTPNVTDTSRVDWACSSSMADKYLPANCRSVAP